ncbi:hypothetical protein A2U01_0025237, partial [Trifolium medium]|nr:hypothetical protein [Trifolium medium]
TSQNEKGKEESFTEREENRVRTRKIWRPREGEIRRAVVGGCSSGDGGGLAGFGVRLCVVVDGGLRGLKVEGRKIAAAVF